MDTLVLSQHYQPLARISWQRAMTLLFQNKIEVIDEYEDREIRTVTVTFKMPSIVRFLSASLRRKRVVKFSRENVYERDKGKCQYCLKHVPRPEITYDHVVPRRLGGKTTWDNVVVACHPCNQQKGGRTPAQAGMKLRSKPVRPKKLSSTFRFTLTWQKGMPLSWKDFAQSVSYWHTELDE